MDDISDLSFSRAQLDEEPILKFFAWQHLRSEVLQEVSKGFFAMAVSIMHLPRSAERAAALRKLLEAKDCAVRGCL